jgi:hypothetical protein
MERDDGAIGWRRAAMTICPAVVPAEPRRGESRDRFPPNTPFAITARGGMARRCFCGSRSLAREQTLLRREDHRFYEVRAGRSWKNFLFASILRHRHGIGGKGRRTAVRTADGDNLARAAPGQPAG